MQKIILLLVIVSVGYPSFLFGEGGKLADSLDAKIHRTKLLYAEKEYLQVAMGYLEIADYFEEYGNWEDALKYRLKTSEFFIYLDKIDLAETHALLAIKIYQQNEVNKIWLANCNLTLGYIYQFKGGQYYYSESRVLYNKALDIYRKIGHEAGMAKTTARLGLLSFYEWDLDGATIHLEQAEQKLEVLGSHFDSELTQLYSWKMLNEIYKGFGNNSVKIKNHGAIMGYMKNTLNQCKKSDLIENRYAKAWATSSFGIYYWSISKLDTIITLPLHEKESLVEWKLRMLDSAEYHIKVSLNLWEDTFSSNHREYATTINDLGMVYDDKYLIKKNKTDLKSAFYYYQIALDKKINILGTENHWEIARLFNNTAKLYFEANMFDEALFYFQKSLLASSTDFKEVDIEANPSLEQAESLVQLSYALKNKALTLEKKYKSLPSKPLSQLVLSFETYLLVTDLMDMLLVGYQEESSGLIFIKRNWWVYENGIHVGWLLYQKTKDEKVLQNVYYLMEKSKVNVLRATINKEKALIFGDVPASMLAKETILKNKLRQTEAAFFTMKTNTSKAEETQKLNAEIFQLKQSYNSLIDSLESNYGNYYNLKYNTKIPTLDSLRKYLTPENDTTLVLEYFVGDSSVFVLGITQEHLILHKAKKDKEFNKNLTAFRSSIADKNFIIADYRHSFNTFTHTGHFLYQTLIFPIVSKLNQSAYKKLIIVPDHDLHLIPFGVFLTVKYSANKPVEYKNLNYMIKQFQIQYSNSVSLLLESQNSELDESPSSNFMGFACSYSGSQDTNTPPLLGTLKEVRASAILLGGKYAVDDQFTTKDIIQLPVKPKILHLAMHAYVDPEKSFASRFRLFPDTNDLYIHHIYQMPLKGVELAVLSSCDTGMGQYERGEGIMSFSKAFSYAGCPSILMSLWAVNDATSPLIIQNFYEKILQNQHKSKALQTAKLNFLSSDISDRQTHPFYWASLVVMGEDASLTIEVGAGLTWEFLVALVLVSLMLVVFVLLATRGIWKRDWHLK